MKANMVAAQWLTASGLTTPAVLDRMASDLADHPSLITADRAFTFAQLRDEVRRTAAAMIAAGVEPADRVAIWSPNTWHWVVGCLATHYAGAVLVPLNTNYTATEATDILTRSSIRLLIAANDFSGTDRVAALDRTALPELRRVVRVPVGAGKMNAPDAWEEFLAGPRAAMQDVDARAAAVRPDDVADIMFTSGTTGRSKGVLCAHRQSLSASAAASALRAMGSADRYLCVVPFFHNYGYKDGILGCLQTGAALVTQRMFDPEQTMRLIAEQHVTVLPGPPVIFQALLDHPARTDYDLSSLRVAGTGGSTVPVALIGRIIDELGFQSVRTGYGLTESSGYGTASGTHDDPVTVATSCGRPIAGYELRIAAPDETGAGEVLLRGPNVMLGYLDDPDATAAAIDSEGWLHTGDIGTVDSAGNLRITDRLTDMYISGGSNVYPAEIEQVLARLDGVAEAAVIGVPHPRLGEVGRAFVVARSDAQLDRQAVIAHAREYLAGYKIPRSVVFLDELPRNASGKVVKTILRRHADDAPPTGPTPQGLGGRPVGSVEEWVADAWQALLNISRPGRRDAFTDLGGDSLAAVEFSEMLHVQFGVTMSVDSLADRPTIAAVVAGLQNGDREQRQPVVNLRTDADGPVCLMVPGIGGHAWKFVPLARALSGPCQVRSLSLMDLRDGPIEQLRTRIRQAAHQTLAPEVEKGRPIVVAGYSFGALIAADLAGWLMDHGVPVAKLILLDPDPLDSAAPQWNSRTIHMPNDSMLAFVPGSPAARQLDRDIVEVSRLLQTAYLDGAIRLPRTSVQWIRSRAMATKHQSAGTVFGTPVTQFNKTVLELNHLDIVEIPGVRQLALWLDQELTL